MSQGTTLKCVKQPVCLPRSCSVLRLPSHPGLFQRCLCSGAHTKRHFIILKRTELQNGSTRPSRKTDPYTSMQFFHHHHHLGSRVCLKAAVRREKALYKRNDVFHFSGLFCLLANQKMHDSLDTIQLVGM